MPLTSRYLLLVSRVSTSFLLLILISFSDALSQSQLNHPGPEAPVYGSIPMQAFVIDPADTSESSFRYLYKGMDVRFEVQDNRIHALITHHLRVRIQAVNGVIAGFLSIPLYADNDLETLESIEGRTWTGPGSWTILDASARRIVNVNERFAVTEFTMPDLRPGVVLEYRYTIRRRYLEELPDFHLMMNQPVDFAMVRIVNSTFLRYRTIPVHGSGNLQFAEARVDTGQVKSIFQGRTAEPLLVQVWHARNVPALRDEPLSGSPDDYRWRIKFQWSEFGNPRQYLESGWDVVAAELRRRPGLFNNIERYEEGRRIGAGFGMRIADPKARLDSIFAHVRDKANPSLNKGITSEENPAIVLEGKPAAYATINQALIAILRGAGFKAWPLLSASRDYGNILADFPSYYQFNKMLVYVDLPGGPVLLDASDRFSTVGMIPEDVVGGTGFVVKDEEHDWVELRTTQTQSALEVTFKGSLSADGALSGSLESRHRGYKARQLLERAYSAPDPVVLAEEFLFRNTNRARYTSSALVEDGPDSEVGLKMDIDIPRFGVSFSNGVEFMPLIVGWLEANPLGEGPRSLPVSLNIPETFVLNASVRVPRDYRMPKPTDVQEARMLGGLIRVAYQQDADSLHYRVNIVLDAVTVPPEEVRTIRSFYDNWVNLSSSRWYIERRRGS
jgi:hypothetical protein